MDINLIGIQKESVSDYLEPITPDTIYMSEGLSYWYSLPSDFDI